MIHLSDILSKYFKGTWSLSGASGLPISEQYLLLQWGGEDKPTLPEIESKVTEYETWVSKQETLKSKVAVGYSVIPEGFNIPFDSQTRSDMQGLGLTLKEAVDIGVRSNIDATSILGYTLTIARARQILIAYAFAYKTIYDESLT